MSESKWITAQRLQFTVDLPTASLTSLLVTLGKAGINLAAFVQQATIREDCGNSFVFVVGSDNPQNPDNAKAVVRTIEILRCKKIPFEAHNVIESNFGAYAGAQGSFATVVSALTNARNSPKILRVYLGENNTIYFDVGTDTEDLALAEAVISETLSKLGQDPVDCRVCQKEEREGRQNA